MLVQQWMKPLATKCLPIYLYFCHILLPFVLIEKKRWPILKSIFIFRFNTRQSCKSYNNPYANATRVICECLGGKFCSDFFCNINAFIAENYLLLVVYKLFSEMLIQFAKMNGWLKKRTHNKLLICAKFLNSYPYIYNIADFASRLWSLNLTDERIKCVRNNL